jgi:hypothetical protein
VIVCYPALLLMVGVILLGTPRDSPEGRGCGWFWRWAAAGSLFMFSFLSGFSIGLLLLPFAAALLCWVAWHSPHAAERTGFALGAGTMLLLIAYLNYTSGHGADSTPWLASGATLSAAGIAAYTLEGHARRA